MQVRLRVADLVRIDVERVVNAGCDKSVVHCCGRAGY